MITKIIIKNIASYNSNGVEIEELTKLNYFFGNNGCGKSTIAKYLDSLQKDTSNMLFPFCNAENFDSDKEEILVFNQDFIEDNFKNNDSLKGVFSLNESNAKIDGEIKDNEKKITEKESKRKSIEEFNETLNNEKSKLREDLANKCFEKRDIFKTFSKIKLEYSGNKKSSLNNIERILEQDIENQDLNEINLLYKMLYEENIINIDNTIDIELYNNFIEEQNKLSSLLDEVIVGKEDVQISKMIKDYGLKTWVAQGKIFLEKTKTVCPFCQKKTIDDDFISQLNSIFDESYKQKLIELEKEKELYEKCYFELEESIQIVSTQYNNENITSNLQMSLKKFYDINLNIVKEKINSPNERKTFLETPNSFIENINSINTAIEHNNLLVNSIDEQKENLKENMWKYLAYECKEDVKKYNEESAEKQKLISENLEEINKLKIEIDNLIIANTELQTKTVNTKEAIDNINQILKNSGFTCFQILEKNRENNISQYCLSRTTEISRENIFTSLSEGEKNFISFLYFYQLCLGTTDIKKKSAKKKIIVIDDPVSSMDSQVLFIVSTLVNRLITYKGKTKSERDEFLNPNITQVFIFTHNYYFYKEVAMKKRPLCKLQSHYRISKNCENITNIQKCDYKEQDDYSLMWQTVRYVKENTPKNSNSQNILIANLFRRILETYANFIGLGNDAWATVLCDENKDSVEHYLKCAFISMINDESHKVSPLDNMYFEKIHNEKIEKLFEIFESIFSVVGPEHYAKMMAGNDK